LTRETLIEETAGGVALLTLNRPKQRNAFNNQMYDELRDALCDAQENDAVRVVVLTGAPGAFSGGQDLGEMAHPPAAEPGEHGFGPFMDRLCQFDKPLLAAVNGVGVGIGLTLLLHCDIVYIAEFGNHRVQKFTRDGRSLGSWGTHGRQEGQLFNPWALVQDADGRIHVLDTNNHRVQNTTKITGRTADFRSCPFDSR